MKMLRINGVDASCEVGGFYSHGCYGKVMDNLNCIYTLQEALAWTAIGLAIVEVDNFKICFRTNSFNLLYIQFFSFA
jgi:hypothetical protein